MITAKDQLTTAKYLALVPSFLSITGVVYVMVDIFHSTPSLRRVNVNNRILVAMCLSMLLEFAGTIMNQAPLSVPSLCQFQSLLLHFGVSSLPILCLCQALHFYLILSGRNPKDFLFIAYASVAWGYALVTCLYLFKTDSFGDAGIWCWITPSHRDLRMYVFYIPLWFCILLSILLVALGVKEVGKQLEGINPKERKKLQRVTAKAFIYAGVFVVSWVPGTTNRVFEMLHGTSPFELSATQLFFCASQGYFTAIAYYLIKRSKGRASFRGTSSSKTVTNSTE